MKRNVLAWASIVISSAALLSQWGARSPLPAAPKITPEGQKAASALSEAYESVADFVKPSVVQINTQRRSTLGQLRGGRRVVPQGPNGPFNLDPKQLEEMLKKFGGRIEKDQFGQMAEGTGSGFVFDDKGHILTNAHVVENSAKLTVTFHDGIEASAKVVGIDTQADVAVIKVENATYPPLPRGQSSKLRVGELVMAVGSPYGLSQSVSTGIISATERSHVGLNNFESFLQTDAAINPGNSGGPLVNMAGQAIGITSGIATASRGNDGVAFAIPIDMAGNMADNLIKYGKVRRARVGIQLAELTPAFARQMGIDKGVKGVLAEIVLPGSPAAKAGIKPGDVITGFNGGPVVSVPNFRIVVSSSEAGKSFPLKFWRDGKEQATDVTLAPAEEVVFAGDLGDRQDEPVIEDQKEEADKPAVGDYGLELQPLSAALVKQFNLSQDSKGLLISNVKPKSPADAAGLEAGQVISMVVKDHKSSPIASVNEFEAIASKSDELAVYVKDGSRAGRFVTLSKAKGD